MRYFKDYNKSIIISFILLSIFNYSFQMPLSQCTKGRASFIEDSSINIETCNLDSSEISDVYPAVINSGLFNTYAQCGVCYEMIGPVGAVKLRVEDSCAKNSDEKCSGDMSHFKIGKDAMNKILGTSDDDLDEDKSLNVTFRMISCNYSENIQILTGENDDYTFSFVVLNNNLAISSIRLQEDESDKLKKLTRVKDNDNYWIYDPEALINYPLTLKIISVSDETVNVTVTSKESGVIFDGDGNFLNPNGYFYNIQTLKRDKDTDSVETCCSYDFSDYSPLYYNGNINKNYEYYINNATLNETSNVTYDGKNTMEINFSTYGNFILKSNIPIRADQYAAIILDIQGNKICKDCLYISSYGKTIDSKIQIKKVNSFSKYTYSLDNLGVDNNTFNGIIIYTKGQNIDINIANIELLENSDAPSAELCADGIGDWTPVVPPVPPISQSTDEDTETNEVITTENLESLSTSIAASTDIDTDTDTDTDIDTEIIINKTEINIINISLNPNMNTIINVNCEPFTKIDNETIKIVFTSIQNNSNFSQFETKDCIVSKDLSTISMFRCEIPELNTIPNNIYKVQSSPDSKYIINYPYDINIENGNIIFEYTPPIEPTENSDTTMTYTNETTNITNILSTTLVTENNTEIEIEPVVIRTSIVITNSIEKTISKGEQINFEVSPINVNNYNNLEQIILLDQSNNNALFLKNCQSITNNNTINNIRCYVSNNLVKSSYTALASGQDIILGQDQTINLTCTESAGGSLSTSMYRTINANISIPEKRNYTLNFDVKFYNNDLNIYPNQQYPYRIIFYGIKSSSSYLRTLATNNNYNANITFINCTTGPYSYSDNYIDGVKCYLPDFISAGIYTKLESEGFDVNPNYRLNLDVPYNFNKSENYLQGNSTYVSNSNSDDDDDDDGSSKDWIVWMVLGIVCAGLIVVIIIACVTNRKRIKGTVNDSINKNNITNSNSDNNDNSLGKIDNNIQDKKDNTISQSETS